MALNKRDKNNFKTALFYLTGGFKDQPDISDNKEDEKFVFNIINYADPEYATKKEYLERYLQSLDSDREILKELADKTFNLLKEYPDLMRELKEKYF